MVLFFILKKFCYMGVTRIDFIVFDCMNNYTEENQTPQQPVMVSYHFYLKANNAFILGFDWFQSVFNYLISICMKVWTAILKKTRDIMVAIIDFLVSGLESSKALILVF